MKFIQTKVGIKHQSIKQSHTNKTTYANILKNKYKKVRKIIGIG
jgi:hypothetical protein